MKSKMRFSYINTSISSLFERLHDIYKTIKYAKEAATPYLEEGYYHIEYKEKIIFYKRSKVTNQFILSNEKQLKEKNYNWKIKFNKDIRRIMVRLLQPLPLRIKNVEKAKGTGELMMITYEGNIKIFDFKNKIVINKLKKLNTFSEAINTHTQFSPFFPTTIKNFHAESQLIFESYIPFLPCSCLTDIQKNDIIRQLFNGYDAYFCECKNKKLTSETVQTLLQKVNSSINEEDLVNILNEFLTVNYFENTFPLVPSHGDLSFKNILTEGTHYFLVDWEMTTSYFFFHDLLNLFLEEGYRGDFSYLYLYMEGIYDKQFQSLFRIFNLDFKKELRDIYLYLVISEQIVFMKKFKDSLKGKSNFTHYTRIIDHIILMRNKINGLGTVL